MKKKCLECKSYTITMTYCTVHKKSIQDIAEFTCDKIDLIKPELELVCRNCKKKKAKPYCLIHKSIIEESPFDYFCDEYSERRRVIL